MDIIVAKLERYFQNSWHFGVLDPQRELWSVAPSLAKIPYLKAQNARGCHIFMQPLRLAHFLLADDLAWEVIWRQHRLPDGRWKPARLVIETSPGNFQVWIHSRRPLSLEEKKHWLQKLGSDPAAHPQNRWGRAPGFRNRKEKYRSPAGHYPLARLVWIDSTTLADIPVLAEPLPQHVLTFHPSRRGPVCRRQDCSRAHFQRPDESATDFAYALALLRRGFTDHQIRARLLEERTSWANHQGGSRISHYLDRTIQRARQILQAS